MKIFIYILCLAVGVQAGVFAQFDGDTPVTQTTPQPSPVNNGGKKVLRAFSFQMENDVLAGMLGLKNEDKDYSGGFKFEFYTDYLTHGILPLLMNRKNPSDRKLNVNSIYIQGLGFTPNREAFPVVSPVRDQRPYASLLVVGRKRIAYLDTFLFKQPWQITSDFYLGQIGGDFNGKIQNWLHKNVTDSDLVMGWENQIANGGRFAINYNLMASTYLWRKKEKKQMHSKPTDLFSVITPHFSIGNIHRNAGLKLSLTNLALDRFPVLSSMGSAQAASAESTQNEKNAMEEFPPCNFFSHFKFEVYAKGTLVSRNSLLMGMPIKRYDNSIHTIDKTEIRSFVDIGGKLYFFYNPYITKEKKLKGTFPMLRKTSVYFELIYRSKEFSFGNNHVFGGFGFLIYNLDL